MASFLCQVQPIQRALGRSAVASAAYRSGHSLTDERLAMEFDFSRRAGVEFSEVRLPDGAPEDFRDRAFLWNAAEKAEVRKDGVPAREVLVALPYELDFEQRRDLVRAFVDRHITGRGMIADIAMHLPGSEGDERNFHAHILVTTRRLEPEGFGQKDRAWGTPQQVRDWRTGWAEIQNQHLRRHLGPHAPQVSHLSLAERVIVREPTTHLGPAATAMERRGEASEQGERNRETRAHNRAKARLRQDYAETADRLASAAPQVEAPIDELIAEAARVREDLVRQKARWEAEREALKPQRIPSSSQVERELVRGDVKARRDAEARLKRVEARVEAIRQRRFNLVRWVRNPSRMIWAAHAELNALAKARSEVRRRTLELDAREAFVISPQGQAMVAARRQPRLDEAAENASKRRTLVPKIKRVDRRIEAATRTLNDLRILKALGQPSLTVPARSPDATRFIRDVGRPAREVVTRFPTPTRLEAIERLNRRAGRGVAKTLTQALFPGF